MQIKMSLQNMPLFLANGSYNSFVQQVGFCKLQGYNTISRETSMAPKMFLDGRVKFGVGLSEVQFQSSTASCGRCINVTGIDNFYTFNFSLNGWNVSEPIQTPFTVFVMDQCTDQVCNSEYLDFDIYSSTQPVMHGNPYNIKWNFIDCPVDKDSIELLFCLGSETCNVNDAEYQKVGDLYNNAIDRNYFSLYVRGSRKPVSRVKIHINDHYIDLIDDSGWKWTGSQDDLWSSMKWGVVVESFMGWSVEFVVDWNTYKNELSTNGYRGGFIVLTDIQN